MDIYTPKYIKIKNYIIENIMSGKLKIGDKIPSENELSELFSVSRVTANTAIRELSTLGMVERIQGKGTFVKSENEFFNTIDHDTAKSVKISSATLESRFHKLEKLNIIVPKTSIVKKLGMKKDEKVYEIIRLMKRNNEVIAIDYSYIPNRFFENSEIDFNELNKSYLHEFLSKFEVIKIKKIHIQIDARFPSDYEIGVLNIDSKKPLIAWDTNVVDKDDKTVAFTTTVAVPDKYKAVITFEV